MNSTTQGEGIMKYLVFDTDYKAHNLEQNGRPKSWLSPINPRSVVDPQLRILGHNDHGNETR